MTCAWFIITIQISLPFDTVASGDVYTWAITASVVAGIAIVIIIIVVVLLAKRSFTNGLYIVLTDNQILYT